MRKFLPLLKIAILVFTFFLGTQLTIAQIENCNPPFNCNSNAADLSVTRVYLGDAQGNMLDETYDCEDAANDLVYLWLVVGGSANKPAYNPLVYFEIWYNGDETPTEIFKQCFTDDFAKEVPANLGVIDYECGQTIQLKNFWMLWQENNNQACSCTGNPKCNSAALIQVITPVDKTPPVVTCPTPLVSYGSDVDECGATLSFTATATDGNDPNPVVKYTINAADMTSVTNYLFPVGQTTVLVTATDASGNSATCSFSVAVVDDVEPTIGCPKDMIVSNDAGKCYASDLYLGIPEVSDNCPGVDYDNDAPLEFPIGETIVTWTATDAAGNTATCVQKVTVEDTQSPLVTDAPDDVTVSTDQGKCSATGVALGTLLASDNCGDSEYPMVSNNGLTEYPLGETTVTWTVTDEHGNTTTYLQTVTVEDANNPYFTECPTNISVTTQDPNGVAVTFSASAEDVCDEEVTLSWSHESGDVFPAGTTTVTITATDDAGNTSICEFDVEVSVSGCIEIGACDKTYIVELYPVRVRTTTVYRGYLDTQAIKNTIVASCGYDLAGLNVTFSKTVFTPANWGENNWVTIKVYNGTELLESCTFRVIVRYPLKGGDLMAMNVGDAGYFNDNLDMTAYPNPTTGKVKIEFFNLNDPKVTTVVYNTNGAVILYREISTEGAFDIDLTGHVEGLYLMRMVADNKEFLTKVILQNR